MKVSEKIIRNAETAKRENKYIEFKESFDVLSNHGWLEILKDIVAIANTGCGVIIFGVKDDGCPSDSDVTPVLNIDPATITDKIAKYTGEQFSDFEIKGIRRDGKDVVALFIEKRSIPMVFAKHGSYQLPDGKQKNAFGNGVVYFRHGAKSEPGNSNDIRNAFEREINSIKKSWLGNIRKIVDAPKGYHVQVLSSEVVESNQPSATPIRIVNDPKAPAYRRVNPDESHPYRLKELVYVVNERLSGRRKITNYDLTAVRNCYDIDENPSYFYKSKFATPTYSEAYINWLFEEYQKDEEFFDKARINYKHSKEQGDSA